jgi:hypothetical protein
MNATHGPAALLSVLLLPLGARQPQESATETVAELLAREWRLGGPRRPGTRYYAQENTSTEIAPDGTRAEPTTIRLWIEVRAGLDDQGRTTIVCRCRRATLARGSSAQRSLQAFQDYEYELHLGVDADGQVFGIEHADFAGLIDDGGEALELLEGFQLYGAFIDFHMFDSLSARGGGEFESDLGSLRRIGQRETTAVGIAVPIHLEPAVLPGSSFKNGSITIGFQGLTLEGAAACALLDLESSDGSFELFLAPEPGLRVRASGGSSFTGSLSLELDSGWMSRLEFREFVVSRLTLGEQELGTSVSERRVRVGSLTEPEFRAQVK